MVNYLETLALIAQARAENDHEALGYASWQDYVDYEFGPERLKLTAEMRQKAITELRLAGASQREIAHTIGSSPATVNRVLAGPGVPNETDESDAHSGLPAKSPLVDAIKASIEDAAERAESHEPAAGPPPAPAVSNHPSASSVTTGEAELVTPLAEEAAPIASSATNPPGSLATPGDAGGPPSVAAGAGVPAPAAHQERTEEVCPTCGQQTPRGDIP